MNCFLKYIMNFLYLIIISINIQFINTYELNKIISKDEVLKIIDEFYISFYCKDDICVSTKNDYSEPYIEIPDKNGNKIKYIVPQYLSKSFVNSSSLLTSKSISNISFFFMNFIVFGILYYYYII